MRVSLKWLSELVDIDVDVSTLCDRLDMTGTKVEAVHMTGATLDGVVVGQVLTKDPHPEADKLSCCTVDVGEAEALSIVCGATNFKAGDKVPVATVGATLPNGMTIKKAKLRGQVSMGMMCSSTELAVGGDASGLLILPEDAPIGVAYGTYAGLSDTVLELEVTPNRPDCLSMVGVAREVGAVMGSPFKTPASLPEEAGAPAAGAVTVRVDNPDLCPRYTARVMRGVKVGPSPDWLVQRITAAGARPINNVVDVTNYILFELGQPLHAFDLDKIAASGGKAEIIVRTAIEGEELKTLDGQVRRLAADTLVIADTRGPVALAGVMGGEDSEVSDQTVDVLLESACFDTSTTSRTSRRLGLISEASLRFERGVDPELAARASDRAAQLLAEVSGGTVAPGIVDVYPAAPEPCVLRLRGERLRAIIGAPITDDEAASILVSLGLTLEPAEDGFDVTVPTFRPDLVREIDLIEEVVRVWGMERVPSTFPGGRERVGALTAGQQRDLSIGVALRAAGLNEHIGYAFADPRDMERLGWELGPDEVPVELINPMSEEQAVMRWTLAAGLLRAVSYNQRRGAGDVHIYELGNVFVTAPGRKQPKQRLMVGGVLAGAWERPSWDQDARPLDFFDGKGAVETLLTELGVDRVKFRTSERAWLQAGRSADVIVRGDVVGWIGEVAPQVLDAYGATGPVTMFELGVAPLGKAGTRTRAYSEVPRYPSVNLDIALVVDEEVTSEQLVHAMTSAGGKLLDGIRLFDVYRDPQDAPAGERRLPEGKKSLAFSLSYRSNEQTLSDEVVRPVHEKLLAKVCRATGAEVRG
ncbi:MAG: phenylalanine--tRNA ligase subunit beta [Coriobacteriia bacterium]|nr:phenylalanine--tRNA ligase subunit beta [Coriobacteriia bacterium]